MRVLAVDTTTALGSVALVDGAVVLGEEHLPGASPPSVELLPAIERLLAARALEPLAVDAFAVAAGPGSFTGLRVGLSTVQGLALAAGRPCLGACILDVLGSGSAPGSGVILVLREAFRGEVYWAAYDSGGRALSAPRVGPLAEALDDAPAGASFVGEAATSHRALIADRWPGARFPPFPRFLAASLGLWAEPRLREGSGLGPGALRPLYIRGVEVRKVRA
jgi:tRNA threonylcarbamoyladenosine biosynthesis protein TsaB